MFLSTQGYSAGQALLFRKDNVLPRLTLRRDQQEDSSERQIDYSVIHAPARQACWHTIVYTIGIRWNTIVDMVVFVVLSEDEG